MEKLFEDKYKENVRVLLLEKKATIWYRNFASRRDACIIDVTLHQMKKKQTLKDYKLWNTLPKIEV